MRVEVTEDHIEMGKQKNPNYCPIALALDQAEGENVWSVPQDTPPYRFGAGQYYASRTTERGIERYKLPQDAQRFITLFDEGGEVGPFTFEVGMEE